MHWNFWNNLKNLLYIYQLDNYQPTYLLKWVLTHKNWFVKDKRKELVWTPSVQKRAAVAVIFQIITTLFLILSIIFQTWWLVIIFAILFFIGYTTIPWLILGNLVMKPIIAYFKYQTKANARKKLNLNSKLIRIGIAGSYGKTSMKEFLVQILSTKFKVASTTGNLNTIWGNARCVIDQVNEETEVFVSEMGEYKIGEIAEIAKLIKPQIGILTGINFTHLERFKKIENTIQACFEIVKFTEKGGKAYINVENENVKNNEAKYNNVEKIGYTSEGCGIVKVKDVAIFIDHTDFEVEIDGKKYKFTTPIIGKHNVSTICVCIEIAQNMGMTIDEIKEAIANLNPVEGRMQSKKYNDIWIINDGYNGNLDGFKAGINLIKSLRDLKGRKIVSTAGVLEQGSKEEEINTEVGKLFSDTFDVVALEPTTVTGFIREELQRNNFKGEIIDIKSPAELMSHTLPNDVILILNDAAENSYK